MRASLTTAATILMDGGFMHITLNNYIGEAPNMSPASAHYRCSTDVDVVADEGGVGAILVHTKTDRIYELSSTGTRFWKLLVSGCSVGEACRAMMQEFDVDEALLIQEIAQLLATLETEQLIERCKDC
jgi:hypothetical protein